MKKKVSFFKKGEKRKQELLNLAYRMFIEKGYENTSIDEIVAKAGIAKGTYYITLKAKRQHWKRLLNDDRKGEHRSQRDSYEPLSIPEKLVFVVNAFRPDKEEAVITDVLERKENIIMHDKMCKKIVEVAVPILAEIVKEGIAQGIFMW